MEKEQEVNSALLDKIVEKNVITEKEKDEIKKNRNGVDAQEEAQPQPMMASSSALAGFTSSTHPIESKPKKPWWKFWARA